jgi:hypothetical protein
MKSTGELVLMNVGGPIEPEEKLDIELRGVIDNQLRLSESGGRLVGLLIGKQELPDQLLQIDRF